jgi:hypothetical protein
LRCLVGVLFGFTFDYSGCFLCCSLRYEDCTKLCSRNLSEQSSSRIS